LHADKYPKENKTWRIGLFIVLVLTSTYLIGQLSTKSSMHIQLAGHKQISLALQQSLEALEGPVVITAYVPDYPLLRARIHKLISPYKPYTLH